MLTCVIYPGGVARGEGEAVLRRGRRLRVLQVHQPPAEGVRLRVEAERGQHHHADLRPGHGHQAGQGRCVTMFNVWVKGIKGATYDDDECLVCLVNRHILLLVIVKYCIGQVSFHGKYNDRECGISFTAGEEDSGVWK